jgi:hypothetical protein
MLITQQVCAMAFTQELLMLNSENKRTVSVCVHLTWNLWMKWRTLWRLNSIKFEQSGISSDNLKHFEIVFISVIYIGRWLIFLKPEAHLNNVKTFGSYLAENTLYWHFITQYNRLMPLGNSLLFSLRIIWVTSILASSVNEKNAFSF